MLSALEQFDRSLFLLLNSLNSPFWDRVMWIISGKATWIPLYLFILYLIWKRYNRGIWIIVILIALSITFADQLSVHAFKETFMRLRPCHEPSLSGMVHLVNGRCGGEYGFVSSHAVNSFTAAALSLLLIRKRWFTITILVWASLVGYSRIYLGVHYPGDVLAGAALGLLTGWMFYQLWCIINARIELSAGFLNRKHRGDDSD
jgi:undecaprenyl-diphosphatase